MRIDQVSIAVAKWVLAGLPVVSDDVHFVRSSHCAVCPFWNATAQRCDKCGCYGVKLWLATEVCPIGHW